LTALKKNGIGWFYMVTMFVIQLSIGCQYTVQS